MRAAVVVTLALGLFNFAQADHAIASIKHTTDIPAQPLETALEALANQLNLQILYQSDLVKDLKTGGAVGQLTVEQTLTRILSGTGLTYRYLQDNAITIEKVTHTNATAPAPTAQSADPSEDASPPETPARSSFRVAQVDQGEHQSPVAAMNPDPGQPTRLEEVIVTAQKRGAENVLNVPIPTTVIDVARLTANDQFRLRDYYMTVPGLGLDGSPGDGGGTQSVSIRGINTGGTSNPTVGMVIDDVPFGSSTYLGQGQRLFPDIDPSSLAQIEVLKGPQGTLYGSSALGGLVRFVSKDPSLNGYSGLIQGSGEDINKGGVGGGIRGMVNVPISDTLAALVNGFVRRDAGYVDNVVSGSKDVNSQDVVGGHASLLWKISDNASLKLSALFQNTHGNGTPLVATNARLQPVFGDLTQDYLKGTGWYREKVQLYSAAFNFHVAGITFTSVTGYGINNYENSDDGTGYYGSAAQSGDGLDGGFPGYGVAGASFANDIQTKKFTEEVRASAKIGANVDWLLGAFYTHESTDNNQFSVAIDPLTGTSPGPLEAFDELPRLTEHAVFGDVTYHFTDRFQLQVGGRQSWTVQHYDEIDYGPLTLAYYGTPGQYVNPSLRASGSAFTYLVTPQYHLNDNVMLYARLSSGYREGGPNTNSSFSTAVPKIYSPDKTKNYDLGLKGAFFNGSLSIDASLYYIDWKDVQITLRNTGGAYIANAGAAKSEGAELAINAHPIKGMTLAVTGSYNDAVLTSDLPAGSTAYGIAGDRLPQSSRYSGSLLLSQDFPLDDQWTAEVGGAFSYIGDRIGLFENDASVQRLRLPAFSQVDLHAALRGDEWNLNLFLNNVADKRGILGAGDGEPGGTTGYSAVFIKPRTIGLSLSRSF